MYACTFDLSAFVFLLFQVSWHIQRLSSVWRRICWTADYMVGEWTVPDRCSGIAFIVLSVAAFSSDCRTVLYGQSPPWLDSSSGPRSPHRWGFEMTQTRSIRWKVPGRAIRPSQRPLPHNTQHSQETYPCYPAGFEPAIPTSKIPQSHALNRVATCIDRRPTRAHNIERGRSRWPCRLSRLSATAWFAGIVRSKPAEGMDVRVMCLLCLTKV